LRKDEMILEIMNLQEKIPADMALTSADLELMTNPALIRHKSEIKAYIKREKDKDRVNIKIFNDKAKKLGEEEIEEEELEESPKKRKSADQKREDDLTWVSELAPIQLAYLGYARALYKTPANTDRLIRLIMELKIAEQNANSISSKIAQLIHKEDNEEGTLENEDL